MTNLSSFTRALLFIGSIGAAIVPAALATSTPSHPTDVVPVSGKAAPCREQTPRLLGAGRAPLAALRLDLRPLASTRRALVSVEHMTSRIQVAKATRASRQTRRTVVVFTLRAIAASGRLPVGEHLAVTFPGSKVPKAAHNTFSLNGYLTTLNGGAYGTTLAGKGGTLEADRFPTQKIGIGATWRVVMCEAVYETPAKETRTYTLRSIANGVISLSYRDIVELDPATAKLVSETVDGSKVTLSLLTLHGRASGTMRVPVENGLAVHQRTATRIFLTAQTNAGGTLGAIIHSTINDIVTLTPVT